jgi:hypothetical protein
VLKPDVPVSAFQFIKDTTVDSGRDKSAAGSASVVKNNSIEPQSTDVDAWDYGGLNDDDFFSAEPKDDDYVDVDALEQPTVGQSKAGQSRSKVRIANTVEVPDEQRLENGNFACHHRCKDKNACKHQCCKQGLEKKPRAKKPKDSEPSTIASNSKSKTSSASHTKVQSKLDIPIRGKSLVGPVEHLDLSQGAKPSKDRMPVAATRLANLHQSTTKSRGIPIIGTAAVTPVSTVPTGDSSRPRFKQSLNPLRSIEEETSDDEPLVESMLEDWNADNDKILPDDGDYMDVDEDMLDAALVGLEDSQSLQDSDQGFQGLDMLDFEPEYREDNYDKHLFVTPHQEHIDGFTEGFEDAVAMFDQEIDDDSTRPGMIKRKRDEGVASGYFSAKKAKTDDEAALLVYTEQSQEEEMDERDEEGKEEKERREKEELRAWLAAELGDCVEMI